MNPDGKHRKNAEKERTSTELSGRDAKAEDKSRLTSGDGNSKHENTSNIWIDMPVRMRALVHRFLNPLLHRSRKVTMKRIQSF